MSRLTAEQWENAYNDLKRKYDKLRASSQSSNVVEPRKRQTSASA